MSRLVVGFVALLVAGAPAAVGERAAEQQVGQVVTVAGTGEAGYSGDGHRATDARIGEEGGIAVGPDGTLFLADQWSGRVRSINGDGIIDTVPGTRGLRSPETDGPEVDGWQYSPSDRPAAVAVTGDGTLYIAGDTVRRRTPDGTVTVMADLTGAFSDVSDIAVDGAGNVYVGGSGQVVRVDPAGTVTPFAGGGALDPFGADGKPATQLRLPDHEDVPIAVDAAGAVYIVVNTEAPTPTALHRVDPDGTTHLVAGGRSVGFGGDGGPAAEAQLSDRLGGVAVDSHGNVYVHDQGNLVVRVIDPEGVVTSVLPPLPASQLGTSGLAVGPDGDVYVRTNARVYRLDRDAVPEEAPPAPDYPSPYADDEPGTVHVVAGSGEEGQVAEYSPPVESGRPMRLAVGPDGTRYYSDTDRHRVMKVAADGTASVFAGNGVPEFGGDGGPATEAALSVPTGLDVGPDGSVYIADSGNERVRKVDPAGVITTVAGNGATGDQGGSFGEDITVHGDGGPATAATVTPMDVAIADDGSLYVAEDENTRVSRVAPDGSITTVAGNGERWQDKADGHPAVEADFFHVAAVALGPEGRVYFLDDSVEYNRPAVRMIDPAGIMRTVAGSSYRDGQEAGFGGDGGPGPAAELNNPADLAVGPDGVLYVADANNARIRAVAPDGTITTFAGTGERADSGDDGPATAAALNEPQTVAVAPDGAVSVIGAPGDRIREIKGGTITTAAELAEEVRPQPALETPVDAQSIAVDRDGGLLYAEPNLLSKVDDGMVARPFTHPELAGVQAMAVAPDGTRYMAAGNVVYRVEDDTVAPVAGGAAIATPTDRVGEHEDARLAGFEHIADLAVSPAGLLYVATAKDVYRVEEDGTAEPAYEGDKYIGGIAVGPDERLYVAVGESGQVYSGDGGLVVDLEASLDLAVDGAGNLYISGYEGIHRLDPDGTLLKVADNPWVDDTRGAIDELAFDRHGNLYYMDNTTTQVKVLVRPAGVTGPFNWTLTIWLAVAALALGALAWYLLRRHRRRTPEPTPTEESPVDSPAEPSNATSPEPNDPTTPPTPDKSEANGPSTNGPASDGPAEPSHDG